MVAAVGLLGGGVAGCSANAPAIVLDAYDPGDGVGAELGEVAVRNLVVVSVGDGAPGVLVGALVSRADSAVNVLVQAEGGLERLVQLEEHQTVELGTGEDEALTDGAEDGAAGVGGDYAIATILENVDPIAGATLPVTVVSETAGSVTLAVPITSPVREYATITPPAEPDVVVIVPDDDLVAGDEEGATATSTATAQDAVDPSGEPTTDPSVDVSADPSGAGD